MSDKGIIVHLSMEEKTLTVGNRTVFFRVENVSEKTNVLLLHGMRFSSSSWLEIDAFRKISQWRYNVYALDYPGFGKSEENAKYSLRDGRYENSSKFVHDFCEETGIKSTTIVGPSMGGAIALKTLMDYPNIVDRVIALAPAGFDSLRKLLYKIEKPVNLVWGTEDGNIDISYGRRFHDLIAGSSLNTIKGAGHALYLDKTAQFFSLLKNLLLNEP